MNKSGNIVLIGMMGSGKTTVGKAVAERLGMGFVDIDQMIENGRGETVSEIFEKYGSDLFRILELQAAVKAAVHKNVVVATGGGTVLNDESMSRLKESAAAVVFLNRDINKIIETVDTTTRPLLAEGADKLYEIYNERLPLYRKWCDIEITEEFDGIGQAADCIINVITPSV